MIELLSQPFMQRALIAGALVGLLGGYYGAFVVQRRLSFLGSGLAHAAFGGVALGLVLNTSPLAIAIPFTIAVALGIVYVQQRTQIAADTAIGVFFAVSMALGLVLIQLGDLRTDAFTYLMGSILRVGKGDLAACAGVTLITLGTAPKIWGRLAYATFDRDLADADRIDSQRDDYILGALLAVTIVVAMKIVGILLASAFLVIPAAAARLWTRSFAKMTLLAMALSTATALGGMILTAAVDIQSNAMIILIQAAIFGIAALTRR